MRWFNHGDRNTKFFHSYVNGRRKKLNILEILTAQGDLINTIENIGEEVVVYFEDQFKEETTGSKDYALLDIIRRLVFEGINENMVRLPDTEEVRQAIFGLSGDSAGDPDGFSGLFYQVCWDIAGEDVTKVVKAFFVVGNYLNSLLMLIWFSYQRRRW